MVTHLTVKYIPEWVPGAGWKRTAKAFAQNFRDMCDLPYAYAKEHAVRLVLHYSLPIVLIPLGIRDAQFYDNTT